MEEYSPEHYSEGNCKGKQFEGTRPVSSLFMWGVQHQIIGSNPNVIPQPIYYGGNEPHDFRFSTEPRREVQPKVKHRRFLKLPKLFPSRTQKRKLSLTCEGNTTLQLGIFGNSGCGKSCMVTRYCSDTFLGMTKG
mgnify:CR=1 FL=1